MLPKLEYVKQARLRLGLTQRRLAALTGVSTSMINQIESGRCKPSYDTARRIFEALSEMEGRSAIKVGEICSRGLIAIAPKDQVSRAVELMRVNGFSQLPVVADGRALGMLTEEGIVQEMVNGDPKKIARMTVDRLMEPSPPVVEASTPAKALIPLVRFCKAVLVTDRGNLMGIVTASDALRLTE